jgi:hypothetical protein
MRFRYLVIFMILVVLVALQPRQGLTQSAADDSCPIFVKKALNDVGNNCASLSRNNACYGFNRLDATFSETMTDDFFSKPSDRSDLRFLKTVSTAALNTVSNEWGVAVLSVQANLPSTLPGQSVKFILFGDVKVENAVKPEAVVAGAAEPIPVTVVSGANLRTAPSVNANVVNSIPRGATLLADGLSQDKRWVRVTYNQQTPGWLNLDVAQSQGDLAALPVIGQNSKTPMQAFYLTTAVGDPKCNQSPSLLVVQGPQKVAVDITANGADIRIGSTIVLKKTADNKMQIIVVSGAAKIGNLIIPAGFTVEAELSADGQSIVGPLANLRPLTPGELEQLEVLEDIPLSILNYKIEVPTEAEIQETLAALLARTPTNDPNTLVNGKVNCAPFKLTSPLDAWAFGQLPFYWDSAPGATGYRLVTNPGATIETTATNATIDLNFVQGDTLTWKVEALLDGEIVCTAGPLTLSRDVSVPRPKPNLPERPVATPVSTAIPE